MASNCGNVIYESGEDRKPDWKDATAAYNDEGTVGERLGMFIK